MAHDNDTHKACMKMGIRTDVVPMWFTGGIGIDIKSKGSYTPLKQWKNSHWVNTSVLRNESPELLNLILK